MRLLCAAFIVCIAQAASPTPMLPARLVFERNAGQTDAGFQFLARARGYSVAISADGTAIRAGNAQVQLQFVNSRLAALEGLDQQPGVVNYLLGNDPNRWLRRIPTYARIRAHNLYPGVDVLYHGTESRLEYDFLLAPGADASGIGLRFTGARSLRVADSGDLLLETAAGELRQKKPSIYQERDGRREIVDGRYRISGDGQVAVDIPHYDRGRPLVIDPELVYAVEVGTGSGGDQVNAIATDSQGNTYIAGQTGSANFPLKNPLPGSSMSTLYRSDAGGPLNPLQSVGLSVTAIAVEPSNSAIAYFVTPAGLFKTTDAGAHATLLAVGLPVGSGIDAVAVDPSNVSTVYLAAHDEYYNGLGVYKTTDGGADWAAINNGLPGAQGPAFITALYVDPTQPSHLFAENAAAQTLSVSFRSIDGGASWVTSSFGYISLTFDPNHAGTVYACTAANATAAAGIYKSTDGGLVWNALASPSGTSGGSVFVAVLALDPFHAGTIWAGTGNGVYTSADGGQTWSPTTFQIPVNELAADPVVQNTFYAGNAIGIYKTSDGGVSWRLLSPAGLTTFAIAPDERMYAGGIFSVKAFVTKLDPTGQNILYSTYFGGSVYDNATGIAVDQQGDACVTGSTSSPDFPTSAGVHNASSTGAFMLKFNPGGDTLGYSEIVADLMTQPAGIALDASANAYITGTTGGDLPVTPGAYYSTPPPSQNDFFFTLQGSDAFVLKVNASGTLSYATYANTPAESIGGASVANAIAVDASGNAYITGMYNLLKFNAAGSALVYTAPNNPWGAPGYIGRAIALDAQGNAYVAGQTQYGHAYVNKYDVSGNTVFNTAAKRTLAGEQNDSAQGVALDSAGNIFVAGNTISQGFPLRGPVQEQFSPVTGFLAELDSSANLLYSSYAGDTSFFQVSGLALDPSGKPILCGNTYAGQIMMDGAQIYPQIGLSQNVWVAKYDTSGIPALRLDSLKNLASQFPVAPSPGELVTVSGAGFAAGAQLFFNNVAATMIPGSSAPTAIVPYALAGQTSAVAQVQSGGQSSNSVLVPIAPAALGIFTRNGLGTGQALAFNQDGTPNSQNSPAPVGSIVTFYATGAGQTVPPGADGVLHRTTPASPALPINVFIAYNYVSSVQFSVGPAPGFPADVLEIQATVPPLGTQPAGQAMVELVENGVPSQQGVTIWISAPSVSP
ncbi:MAG: SBBP repeat-containing protein [Bryobacteraceae bacterium]|jgi:uncharacterized protein (TIGR03437 family)